MTLAHQMGEVVYYAMQECPITGDVTFDVGLVVALRASGHANAVYVFKTSDGTVGVFLLDTLRVDEPFVFSRMVGDGGGNRNRSRRSSQDGDRRRERRGGSTDHERRPPSSQGGKYRSRR